MATSWGAVAMPFAPVVAEAVLRPPANAALAPLAGALKVTLAPATGWDEASTALTASCVGNAVPTVVV